MITAIKNIIDYRGLIAVLAWKNVTVRYKQAYLGIGWAVLKPLAFDAGFHKLLVERAAGEWSDVLCTLYTMNPLAGIIDSFQNVVLRGLQPDFVVVAARRDPRGHCVTP